MVLVRPADLAQHMKERAENTWVSTWTREQLVEDRVSTCRQRRTLMKPRPHIAQVVVSVRRSRRETDAVAKWRRWRDIVRKAKTRDVRRDEKSLRKASRLGGPRP